MLGKKFATQEQYAVLQKCKWNSSITEVTTSDVAVPDCHWYICLHHLQVRHTMEVGQNTASDQK